MLAGWPSTRTFLRLIPVSVVMRSAWPRESSSAAGEPLSSLRRMSRSRVAVRTWANLTPKGRLETSLLPTGSDV